MSNCVGVGVGVSDKQAVSREIVSKRIYPLSEPSTSLKPLLSFTLT